MKESERAGSMLAPGCLRHLVFRSICCNPCTHHPGMYNASNSSVAAVITPKQADAAASVSSADDDDLAIPTDPAAAARYIGHLLRTALCAPDRGFSQSLAVDGLVEIHRRRLVWRRRDSPLRERSLVLEGRLQSSRGAAGMAGDRAAGLQIHGSLRHSRARAHAVRLRLHAGHALPADSAPYASAQQRVRASRWPRPSLFSSCVPARSSLCSSEWRFSSPCWSGSPRWDC